MLKTKILKNVFICLVRFILLKNYATFCRKKSVKIVMKKLGGV